MPRKPPPSFDDNPEWTAQDFKRARPASEVHSAKVVDLLVRKGGRPPKPVEERKRQVTMRFDPTLLAAMRSTGPGWQVRAEEVLRRAFVARARRIQRGAAQRADQRFNSRPTG